MDDIKLTQLGDKEAAKRLTNAGELVPCPWCGKTPTENDLMMFWNKYTLFHDCKKAGPMRAKGKTRHEVCLAWNTRTPILTAEQIAAVERIEEK